MKTIKIFLGLLSFFIMYSMSANYYNVNAKKKFYEKINCDFDDIAKKNKLAIAYIKEERNVGRVDKSLRNKLKDIKNVFKEASKGHQEVRFIAAELSKEDFFSLIDELGISKDRKVVSENDPIIVLFKSGKIAKIKDKTLAVLYGFVSRYQIDGIVHKTFKKEIRQDQEERKKEQDRQENLSVIKSNSIKTKENITEQSLKDPFGVDNSSKTIEKQLDAQIKLMATKIKSEIPNSCKS